MDEWECSASDVESMVESDSDDSSFDIDDLKFDLVTKGQVFYILYTPAGLELINIQSL